MAQEYTIYSISFNGRVIYVGLTSHGQHRWTCHKTKARQANIHSRHIHNFMRDNTTDPKTFPEFAFEVICKCYDEDIARDLEQDFQNKYDVPNRHTRPLFFNDKMIRRNA